ncbi:MULTISPECIES: bifunctional glycosyltransferase family 2/GtrA family protein [unclassified Gordonia (in: high G+C Gram-positive bacteria)]|uniref:bifunctional glycosyltransferase family 2/GtrA family protein n=1 Tax=unclassified Gordonia (in: high G+C Gram-positive bacteria) TaxID=2657482 RepID=UPI001FFF6040|nr:MULTISPECIES: bifunctional glycosyltransferase family 2/GtrA family protein [unclassified Gordonia (in: high G+C Gram-positive bacteria)]UQE74674.1 bifunctional glycosyltransferase family 2/GtrA family protein [Gordonia sp. PP30]
MTTTIDPEPAETEPKAPPPPVLDVVVPVYNEERDLERTVLRLREHLAAQVPYTARITVADNASTDATLAIAQRLTERFDGRDGAAVRVVHLDEKGRGRALTRVWGSSDAQIVAYCDVDLSTDLNALMPLIAPLISGHSDVAIGTRLSRSSHVVRGAKREFISRSYNLILRLGMRAHFSDAQCGFKAMRTDVARELLPYVADTGWFWDTEMLVLAERIGLRIAEVPVDWVDDPDSSVDIVATAVADLKGCARVGWALAAGRLPIDQLRRNLGRERDDGPDLRGVPTGMTGQVIRFVTVGVVSTAAYALLYLLLHGYVGAQIANFLALAITAVLNTAANRRFTFGIRGRSGMVRHHVFGWAVFLFGWAVTAGALAGLHAGIPHASRGLELTVLIVANLVATVTRFVGLRWVFVRRNPNLEVLS